MRFNEECFNVLMCRFLLVGTKRLYKKEGWMYVQTLSEIRFEVWNLLSFHSHFCQNVSEIWTFCSGCTHLREISWNKDTFVCILDTFYHMSENRTHKSSDFGEIQISDIYCIDSKCLKSELVRFSDTYSLTPIANQYPNIRILDT